MTAADEFQCNLALAEVRMEPTNRLLLHCGELVIEGFPHGQAPCRRHGCESTHLCPPHLRRGVGGDRCLAPKAHVANCTEGVCARGRVGYGRTVLPLRTERLTVRMMREVDLPAFIAYRNDPDIARYQDWALPFTEHDGRRIIDDQATLAGPTPGTWVQLAVDRGGVMVGDVAVGLDDAGTQATVGYTLAAAHQGKGYAGEALAAVVDALCAAGVHRFEASLYPENIPSMRVVEAVGFTFESLIRESVALPDSWADDLRYSLLAADRHAWRERDLSPVRDVRLVALDGDNLDAYMALATHWSQQKFVRPVAPSLGQASVPITVRGGLLQAESFGIEADGAPVGFLQLADRSLTHDEPYLWRLLIDRWHQRRGIGTRVLDLVLERTKAAGHRTLTVSYGEYPGTPRPVYLRFGFVPTGEIVDNEAVARLTW